MIGRFAAICIVLSAVACAGQTQTGDPALLDFIRDGQTSREQTILALGQPSATFESERILTYRIGGEGSRGYFVRDAAGTWYETSYSLVLVFDETAVLKAHSLVPIR